MNVLQIKARIKRVLPDAHVGGAAHHHLFLDQIEGSDYDGELYCAIRYGDAEGLHSPILDLKEHTPIELKGEYLVSNSHYPNGKRHDPVIHFTHHPVGFVIYNGKKYS